MPVFAECVMLRFGQRPASFGRARLFRASRAAHLIVEVHAGLLSDGEGGARPGQAPAGISR